MIFWQPYFLLVVAEAGAHMNTGAKPAQFSDFQQNLITALLSGEVIHESRDGGSLEGEQRPQQGIGFSSPDFFKKWFRGTGKVFYFLFKKNLKVTNIQIAELLALLLTHVHADPPETAIDLHFLSSQDFNGSNREYISKK